MAFQQKRLVQDKSTQIVYMGDGVVTNGTKTLTYPIFIRLTQTQLILIGGKTSLMAVPTKEYTTRAGLKHKFFRDEEGALWRTEKGTTKAGFISNTELVTPPKWKAPLTIYLKATTAKYRQAASASTVNRKVTIKVPNSINSQQAALFFEKLAKALVVGWKFGKTIEVTTPLLKAERTKAETIPTTYLYIPVGIIEQGNLTGAGAISSGKGTQSKTIVYASILEAAAVKFGFTTVAVPGTAEIEKGTKLDGGAAKGGGKYVGWNVFANTKVYSQIWTDVSSQNDETKTAISNSSASVKVKCRFTVITNSVSIKTRKANSKSEYAYFAVPAGTPKGMIAKFILQFKNRPLSFQISTDGKFYGISQPLPPKKGLTVGGNRTKVRNRRRGAKK